MDFPFKLALLPIIADLDNLNNFVFFLLKAGEFFKLYNFRKLEKSSKLLSFKSKKNSLKNC